MKRFLLTLASMMTLFISCSKDEAESPSFTTFEVTPSQMELLLGESEQITIDTDLDTDLSGLISYSVAPGSANYTAVTISESGLVTATEEGSCIIVVASNDGLNVVQIPVEVSAPASISLSATSLSFDAGTSGEIGTLTATVDYLGATSYDITWSSSNTDVITFVKADDTSITLSALKDGAAVITATVESLDGISASCGVIVGEYEIYTVTFNDTELADQLIVGGTVLAEPTEPLRDGYTFLGWFEDEALTTEYSFSQSITSNTTIYASWWNDNEMFEIWTLDDLKTFRDMVNDGIATKTSAILMDDISMDATSWTPIGAASAVTSEPRYAATFDGNGKSIKNLYLSVTSGNFKGLFGVINGATIKNLTLSNPSITASSSSAVAAITGSIALEEGTMNYITDCTITGGAVKGSAQVGAFVGGNNGNYTITNCHNVECAVTGSGNYTGGILGRMVTADSSVTQDIIYCSNSGTIKGSTYVGGVAGYSMYGARIIACGNSGSVTGSGNNVGGVIGSTYSGNSYVYGCYNRGDIYGVTNIGGVVGSGNAAATQVRACYNTGGVYASTSYAGGIVGKYNSNASSGAYLSTNFDDNYFVEVADGATDNTTYGCGYDSVTALGSDTNCTPLKNVSLLNGNVGAMNDSLSSVVTTSYYYIVGDITSKDAPEIVSK